MFVEAEGERCAYKRVSAKRLTRCIGEQTCRGEASKPLAVTCVSSGGWAGKADLKARFDIVVVAVWDDGRSTPCCWEVMMGGGWEFGTTPSDMHERLVRACMVP